MKNKKEKTSSTDDRNINSKNKEDIKITPIGKTNEKEAQENIE